MILFNDNREFKTESGTIINGLTIAYDTYGTPNADMTNVVWVCHALTANSDVADWWPETVVPGRFLDPEKYFVVCANVLGSCYGTTGPTSINPETGELWGDSFPIISVRDMVECHRRLAEHLDINSIEMLIGSSLGGFQCLEWAIIDPSFVRNLVLIATGSYTRPWAAAFNEAQRMALLADSTYGIPGGGKAGIAAARAIAMLSYRGAHAYDVTQRDTINGEQPPFERRAASYQRHQGTKLANRFDPCSYMRMTRAVDSHDVGRGRGGIEKALATVSARTLVISITSDILFTPADHQDLVDNISGAIYHEIDSDFGHDGFLIENKLLDRLIKDFLTECNQQPL